jgi:ribose transport system ATP-binding protein
MHRPAGHAVPGSALDVRSLRKTFSGVPVLRDFDLRVAHGEIHGLVGENGSGKSTFIKIVSGYHLPDAGGHVSIDGGGLRFGDPASAYRLGCRVVHQDLGLVDELSIADNMCLVGGFPTSRLGLVRQRAAVSEVREALAAIGIDEDPARPLGELSPALKTGVAVARAMRHNPGHPARLLILDEPTATMPASEVDLLLRIVNGIAGRGVGVIYVSHRIDEILDLCERVTVLRDGRKIAAAPAAELNHRTLISLMLGSEEESGVKRGGRHNKHSQETGGDQALVVENLTCETVSGFTLRPARASITGIAGITGSGRDRILGAIFGAAPRTAGTVTLNGRAVPSGRPSAAVRAGLAYLPPDRKRLGAMVGHTARENLTLLDLKPFRSPLGIDAAAERAAVRSWFGRLSVRPANAVDLTFGSFSGGNQQKILFAKWMRISPSVFLLDEPTQGVDVGAKRLLHQDLRQFADAGGTVVVSSTDIDELCVLCTRVVVMRHGRVVADLAGPDINQAAVARACLGDEERGP